MRIETPLKYYPSSIFTLFQPVASMMRIETASQSGLTLNIIQIPASRQYDEDWNKERFNVNKLLMAYSSQSPVWWGLKPFRSRSIPASSFLFQPVASMMRIETATCLLLPDFLLIIPASRQYDEDWNKGAKVVKQLVNVEIPASRQYDEDWNW